MIIDTEPGVLGYTRTPIIYLVNDPNAGLDKFQYIAEVWVWQGYQGDKPVNSAYTLKKPPRGLTGNCLFDMRTLASDFFIDEPFDFQLLTDTLPMYAWLQVDFGYQYEDAGGSLIVVPGVVQSNAVLVFNGYTYAAEGINYVPTEQLGWNLDSYFMTDRPLISEIPYDPDVIKGKEPSQYLWITKPEIGQVITNVRISLNGGLEVVDIAVPTNGIFLQFIPAGIRELSNLFVTPVGDWEYYTIQGNDGGAGSVFFTQQYRFNVIGVCKFGYQHLRFINRYGVWDDLYFYGSRRDTLEMERGEVMHSPTQIIADNITYDNRRGQFRGVAPDGREKAIFNSGWLTEEWNEMFKQLMLAGPLHDPDNDIAYLVKNTGHEYKHMPETKLINYKVELAVGNAAINTIY